MALTRTGKLLPFTTLTRQHRRFVRDLPQYVKAALQGRLASHEGLYSEQARRIMARLGWTGGPLGRAGVGHTEPVEAVGTGNGTHGLGYKKPAHSKNRRDRRTKYSALISPDGDGDGATTTSYGVLDGSKFKVAALTPRGRPVATGEIIDVLPTDSVRELAWWGEGVLGIAQSTYPHPSGWTVEGASDSPTLDKLTVRILTAVFRQEVERRPTCKVAWGSRVLTPIHWRELGLAFQGGLLTPRDYTSYYKNILHRGLFLRVKQTGGDRRCRCCGLVDERFAHLPLCCKIRPFVWLPFVILAKAAPACYGLKGASVCQSLILLGTTAEGRLLPRGLLALWIVIWKFVILRFTQVDMEQLQFDGDAVWEQALRRFTVRVNAAVWRYNMRALVARAQERPAPSPASTNKLLEPVAQIDEGGALAWAPFMRDALVAVGIELPKEPIREPVAQGAGASPPVSVESYLRRNKISFSRSQEQVEPVPEREHVPLVCDRVRYAWSLQRMLSVRKVKGVVTLYSRYHMTARRPEIVRVEAGDMLPIESNPTEDATVDAIVVEARRARDALGVVQSRAQLLVFEARCDEDRAEEYAQSLWQDGLGELQPVTELPRMGKDVIEAAVRKAFARYRSAIADVYSLRGPVARAVTQVLDETSVSEPAEQPEASEPAETLDIDEVMQREMEADPFELELEIERELLSEQRL